MQRVEREIREVIATYLLTGFREPLPGIVSVSRVIVSKDLRQAKVYVSVLGQPEDEKQAIELLQENAYDVQGEINRRLRMRYCPKLTFYRDEAMDNVLRVEKILRDLNEQKNTDSTEDN